MADEAMKTAMVLYKISCTFAFTLKPCHICLFLDFELDADELEAITCIQTLSSCKVIVLTVAFSKTYLFAASTKGDIHVLRLDLFVCEKVIHGHNGIIYSLYYNEKTCELYSSSSDNTIKCWNFACDISDPGFGQLSKWVELYPDSGDIYTLAFDTVHNNLYFGCQDGSIQSIDFSLNQSGTCKSCEEVSSSKLYRFFTHDTSPIKQSLSTSLRCVVSADRVMDDKRTV